MPPTDPQQVRNEMAAVGNLAASLNDALSHCREFQKLQKGLLGKLDPDSGIAQTHDYADQKYTIREGNLQACLHQCRDLIDAYLGQP